ncbi:extracellular superoxide dismutase [Cu-Zn] [Trichomycterus rosablanca]|uniref:extracellular superoxide dismutase [Cu-Zn] n=1 Tax=Trichomycterus rosablanca TaxID=2290929 RepID=UPI002F3611C0
MKPTVHYTLMVLLSVLFSRITLSEATSGCAFQPENKTRSLYAACRMHPNTQLAPGMPKVYGQVLFKQSDPEEGLAVRFRLHGLPPSATQLRAIHIHQYGDLSEGCASTGGHYNPLGVDHPNHPGDFGNFIAQKGKIRRCVYSKATLHGELSVLGRAVVIHEKQDDMGKGHDAGSLLHGNAGGRLACCVIGITSPTLWDKYHN